MLWAYIAAAIIVRDRFDLFHINIVLVRLLLSYERHSQLKDCRKKTLK